MRYRTFGWTGVQISVVGQGTWQMERDPAAAVQALRRGLDLGMTHIDTAELYGSGRVEEIVGEAIAGRRREVFLASKVLPRHATYRGVLRACEASLRRLRTDFLDLYLLHWPNEHPLEGTVAAFEHLVQQGKIRFWGVSNFDEKLLEEVVRLAGPRRVACNQVLYHLGQRSIEHYVLPACERLEVAVVGYSPFGQGHFRSHPVLEEIAARRKATPRQVALAFLVRRPSLFTIPKASQTAHVEENARAADLELSEAEVARIHRAFPLPRPRPGQVPVL
ncbi:MAG: oxidoreductase [candidate division GAL15 bacterium]